LYTARSKLKINLSCLNFEPFKDSSNPNGAPNAKRISFKSLIFIKLDAYGIRLYINGNDTSGSYFDQTSL
jgi:hypothetical protein